MGRRAMDWWFYAYTTILDDGLQSIMGRAAAHCIDDKAFLGKSQRWLAEKAGTSVRSLERHEPTLAKLELLVRGDRGYRLPLFFAYDRQNGGATRQIDRQNGGPLTLPYSEGLKSGKGITRAREDLENRELQEFTTAFCTMCDPQHEFRVEESYFDLAPRRFACPEFVVKRKVRSKNGMAVS